MVEYLVEQMTDKLVKDTPGNQKESSIVRYGLEVLVTTSLQTLGFLVIGLIFNRIFELSLIMIGFAALRVFVGGSHANSRIKCFLSSLAILMIEIYIYEAKLMDGYLAVVPIVILLMFAPRDHKNKRLSVKQKSANRRRALCLYSSVFTAYAFFSSQERWLSDGPQLVLIGFFLEAATIIDCKVLLGKFNEGRGENV